MFFGVSCGMFDASSVTCEETPLPFSIFDINGTEILSVRQFWVWGLNRPNMAERGPKWPKMAWMSVKMTEIDWFDDVTALTDQFWVPVLTSSCSEAGPAKNLNFGTVKFFYGEPPPIIFLHFHSTKKKKKIWELEPNRRICFFLKKWTFFLTHFWTFWANFRSFWSFLAKLSKNVPNLTISMPKKLKNLSRNQKWQIWPPKRPKKYPEPKIAPKMSKGGQIWQKCITRDLIMIIRVKKNHAEMAWNYPITFKAK